MGDLFSAGFAWADDPVAAPATLAATSAEPAAATGSVRRDVRGAPLVATVATVATGGDRGALSHEPSPISATHDATAKSTVFGGVETDFQAPVAGVASVATWLNGVEAMRRARPAPAPYHAPWRTILQDAASFVSLWGDDAIRMGWSTLDVFGVNPDPAAGRYDRLGLVILLNGRPVQCLEEHAAHIGRDGKPTVFRRALRAAGAVPIWQWVEGLRQ